MNDEPEIDYTAPDAWLDWRGYTQQDRETFSAAYAALVADLRRAGQPINPAAIRDAISKAHKIGMSTSDLIRAAKGLYDPRDFAEPDTDEPPKPGGM